MFSYIHLCCICIVSVWFVPKCQSLFTECCFAFCCRERSIDSHAVRRWQTMVDLCSYVHRLWVLLATMCVHGGTSLPFWCLFYEGPRRMYKAMQRKCGCGGTDVFDDQSTDGAEAGCCESLCCPRSLRVHMVFSQGAIFPTDNNSTRDTVLQGQVTQHRTDVPPAYDDALRDTLVPSPVELQHLGGVQAFGAVSHRVQTTETAMDAGTLGDTSVLPPSSLVTNTELPPPDDLPPAYEQVAGANADAHANVEEPIMLRAASVADNESMSIVAGGQAAMHDAAPNYSTE
eukprot:m.50435 g.50435  ORF g.50435 m.50435 type:complete len:287 (-) comp15374_c1_seq6:654-1514(-)